MSDNKLLSGFFILFLVINTIAYVFNPDNLFPGKGDDILVCLCGLIAIRSCYKIGFRAEEGE